MPLSTEAKGVLVRATGTHLGDLVAVVVPVVAELVLVVDIQVVEELGQLTEDTLEGEALTIPEIIRMARQDLMRGRVML